MKKYELCSDELGSEFESDSIKEIYDEMNRLKKDDKEHHDKKSYYVNKLIESTEDTYLIQEGLVFRRKNKYYFKAK